MSLTGFAPLAAAVAVSLVTALLHRRVRPQLAASLLTAAIIGVAAAAIPTTIILSVGFLAHLPSFGGGFDWCRAVLGLHTAGNPWTGAVATVALAAGAFRTRATLAAWWRHRCAEAGAPAVVPSNDWFAYSLPGPGRRIAISSGLVDALDGDELEIVMAHELGHARHRHDRHLLIAELAAGLVPPVELLRSRLRFALERWADEESVVAAAGDRERVALTLARVALGRSESPDTLAAFGGLGTADRVDALLHPRVLRHEKMWLGAIVLGLVSIVIAAGVQVHHLAGLLVTLCPG